MFLRFSSHLMSALFALYLLLAAAALASGGILWLDVDDAIVRGDAFLASYCGDAPCYLKSITTRAWWSGPIFSRDGVHANTLSVADRLLRCDLDPHVPISAHVVTVIGREARAVRVVEGGGDPACVEAALQPPEGSLKIWWKQYGSALTFRATPDAIRRATQIEDGSYCNWGGNVLEWDRLQELEAMPAAERAAQADFQAWRHYLDPPGGIFPPNTFMWETRSVDDQTELLDSLRCDGGVEMVQVTVQINRDQTTIRVIPEEPCVEAALGEDAAPVRRWIEENEPGGHQIWWDCFLDVPLEGA